MNLWKLSKTTTKFLLTRLIRGMTVTFIMARLIVIISTHTPHTRHDCQMPKRRPVYGRFLLTRLIRGMTVLGDSGNKLMAFLLTRLIRGMTPSLVSKLPQIIFLLTRLIRGMTGFTAMRIMQH